MGSNGPPPTGPASPTCYTPDRMGTNLAELWRYRDLLRNLVARDLRIKYKGSTIGFAWSLLHPLMLTAVYTLAFRYVLAIRIEHFPRVPAERPPALDVLQRRAQPGDRLRRR